MDLLYAYWPSWATLIKLLIGLPVYAALGGLMYSFLNKRWPSDHSDVLNNHFRAAIWPVSLIVVLLIVYPVLGAQRLTQLRFTQLVARFTVWIQARGRAAVAAEVDQPSDQPAELPKATALPTDKSRASRGP